MPVTLTLLGTGTSAGIPLIGCDCPVCRSDDPHDRRDRPGAMVRYLDGAGRPRTILIDTTPDLRHQMLRHQVTAIDGVVYTHAHADHIFGLDDLRRFNAVMKAPIDIYGESDTLTCLRQTFGYVFDESININQSFVANLIPNTIAAGRPFTLAGRDWMPIRLLHGRLPIIGLRVGAMAYCTDVSAIPPESFPQLQNLDVLVLDCLRYRHHPTHLNVEQALAIIDQLKPRRAYLTHISHEIRHAELQAKLPDGVFLGYDGLVAEVAPE